MSCWRRLGAGAAGDDQLSPLDASANESRLVCNTLWIGSAIGRIERACLRSLLRHGHQVHLYCYDRVDGIPAGVDVRDAAEILPRSRIVRYVNGSYALFANHFRYELQRRGLGLWVDADVYCIKPMRFETEFVAGWQDARLINIAVLRLPPQSPIVDELLGLFDGRTVPRWMVRKDRNTARKRLKRTGDAAITEMPWGTTGPRALSHLIRHYGMERYCQPREVFYPVTYDQAGWICDPSVHLEEMLSDHSVAIHLWNQVIKLVKERPALPGSFLARLHAEGE